MNTSSFRRPLCAAALLASVLLVGCGHGPPPRPDKTVEVLVTTPITDDVLDYQDFTGRLDAFRSVDVRARVQGYITEAPFKEGDRVEKGNIIFKIEHKTYKADLAKTEADLQQAIAERNLQEANAARARQMVASRAISREEYDQIIASQAKTGANVGSLQAARD